jgi:hypothetical protein
VNLPQHNPDPWHTGPLPGPPHALTAEEQADWEAYLDDCHSEGMRELDQRAEYEPGREPQLPAWMADWWARGRTAQAEAEAEAEP